MTTFLHFISKFLHVESSKCLRPQNDFLLYLSRNFPILTKTLFSSGEAQSFKYYIFIQTSVFKVVLNI